MLDWNCLFVYIEQILTINNVFTIHKIGNILEVYYFNFVNLCCVVSANKWCTVRPRIKGHALKPFLANYCKLRKAFLCFWPTKSPIFCPGALISECPYMRGRTVPIRMFTSGCVCGDEGEIWLKQMLIYSIMEN